MARTISWIHRVRQIRAAIEKSSLSMWERSDLEALFELQPRAASKMLAVLPRGRGPGRSLLVERNALLAFLDRVEQTGALPRARTKVSKKKLRLTVRPAAEGGKGSMATIPATVMLGPGRLAIDFQSPEHLIEQLWAVALAARDDTEAFLLRCLPERSSKSLQPSEREAIEAALAEMEAARGPREQPGVVMSIAAAAEDETA